MIVTMNKKTGPVFQFGSEAVTPLMDDRLSNHTKTMLMGYEILDACSITMALENHIWQRYKACYQDKLSPIENRLMNAYSLIPAYAKQVSDTWFSMKDDINLFYEEYVMKFIALYKAISSQLNDLGRTLEQESSKVAFAEILQLLLHRIYYLVGPKVDSLLQDLNQLREYLAFQAGEAAKQIDHIYQEILAKAPAWRIATLESLASRMREIQLSIGDLNMAFLERIYSNKLDKAFTLDKVAVGGRLEVNPIALATNKNEYALLPTVLKTNANQLNDKHAELQTVTTELKEETSPELASVALLNSELIKLQDLAQTMTQVVVNFRDAWMQLSNNLEQVVESLGELKSISPELKEIMLTIHLESLKSNMESMERQIQTLAAHKLLKMPIAKELTGTLEFLGRSDGQIAIHPFVLEQYLKEMNYTVCPSSSGA